MNKTLKPKTFKEAKHKQFEIPGAVGSHLCSHK